MVKTIAEIDAAIQELLIERARLIQSEPMAPLVEDHARILKFIYEHPGCNRKDLVDGLGFDGLYIRNKLTYLKRNLEYIERVGDQAHSKWFVTGKYVIERGAVHE